MTHLTDLQCSAAADDALLPAERDDVQVHLASCTACQGRVALFATERQLIREILETPVAVDLPAELPRFTRRLGLMELAIANIATGLLVWFAQFLWKTILGEFLLSILSWFSLPVPDVLGLVVDAVLNFILEGTTMIDAYLFITVTVLLALAISGLAYKYRQSRMMLMTISLVCVLSGLTVSMPASALDFRRSDSTVSIAETETIDDTLVIAADTVIVDGHVTGNLVAAGRRVIVNGRVDGNLITFADNITLRGEVGGTGVGGASSVDLGGAVFGGDLWFGSEKIIFDKASSVGGNLVMGAESILVDGQVAKDFYAFADNLELSGDVGEDLEVFAHRVSLLGDAVVGGNLRFRSHDEDQLQQAEGATVHGQIEFLDLPEDVGPRNRYASGKYYAWQLLRLASAFLAGYLFLTLVPVLRKVDLEGGMEGVKTGLIGLVTLVSTPFVLLIVGVTVIGLPLAMIGAMAWILMVYLAKIILAAFVGELMLESSRYEDSLVATLGAGLVVVIFTVNIPVIGGIASFLMTILGIGMLMRLVLQELPARDAQV